MEGEALLPLASGSYTIMDLMQRFKIDSLLDFDASGNMSYDYYYEQYGIVKGEELLRFKDLNYNEHFTVYNPFPQLLPHAIDTVVSYTHTLTFEAEHIGVVEAVMRSGHFDFTVASNIGQVHRVVVRSNDIKDAEGHNLELDFPFWSGSFGFDLDGMHYETQTPNTLNLSYEVYLLTHGSLESELYLDVDITGRELVIQEMKGYVESYGTRNQVDTVFSFLPDQVLGALHLNEVNVRLRERNTFGIGARLVVDTADVICEGLAPYSLFQPMPLVVDLPTQMTFEEIHNQTVSGKINAMGGRAYASSDFIINPDNYSGLVTVFDTSEIDVRVDVSVPMAFRVDEARFQDTVDMNLGEIKSPEWVKKLTLEMTLNSTIPFDLVGSFMAYDTLSGKVTDVLLDNTALVAASYDGQTNKTTLSIEVTEERLMTVLHSNKLIVDLRLDTDGHDIKLNASQSLGYYLKAKVEYDGIVELENE